MLPPRFLRPIPEAALFEAIDRAQSIASGRVRALLLRAIAALQDSADRAIMARAEATEDGGLAVTAFDWEEFARALRALSEALSPAVRNGTILGLAMVPAAGTPLDAAVVGAAAEAWLASHTGELITAITENTRLGIRALVSAAIRGPGASFGGDRALRDKIAALLRVRQLNGLVGLTEQQARSLAKYGAELVARNPDITARLFNLRMEQRFAKLLRVRATAIARTEASFASNAGQLVAWREAIIGGQLSALRYEREWVTRVGRACERCAAFDGARAPMLGGVFVSSSGATAAHPPLHPWCQCSQRIRRVKVAESELTAADIEAAMRDTPVSLPIAALPPS